VLDATPLRPADQDMETTLASSTPERPKSAIPPYGGPGATSFFASRYDQRFSYCLYIPQGYDSFGEQDYPLFVVVHGSHRNAEGYRDALADFAETQQCVILSPLFPSGIIEPGEGNNYKEIAYHGIRYDLVLLAMVDEVAETYRVQSNRFMLYGYSGGGQFAHRFFVLHPQRLIAVSIGAPGAVTRIDESHDWWLGTRNLEECFGIALDLASMRDIPVQMVVGGNDTESMAGFDSQRTIAGAEAAGATRVERLEALRSNFEAHGIEVDHSIVPGLGHESYKFLPVVTSFFAGVLSRQRT
jgi:predicted peptidase